mmetsp:Transcript_15644/g.23439  ORF Transcript_15644/g.23439 Transcript_15644/m.23439 type:complete len:148 (-) Transcript_15644:552-995(-)
MSSSAITRTQILSTYRTITRLIKGLPSNQKPQQQLASVQESFRENTSLTDPLEIKSSFQKAGEKIAYYRIITPKASSSSTSGSNGTQRWVYTKDGAVEIDGEGKARLNGRVISNWDGKNLDPCSIKTHQGQLKRMGFANNLHAKGLF